MQGLFLRLCELMGWKRERERESRVKNGVGRKKRYLSCERMNASPRSQTLTDCVRKKGIGFLFGRTAFMTAFCVLTFSPTRVRRTFV